MSKKIKFLYALNEVNSRTFVAFIPGNSTCADVLNLISKKAKDEYKYLFYQGSEMGEDDEIFDFWELDNDYIFIASKTPKAPTYEFVESIKASKNKATLGSSGKISTPSQKISSSDIDGTDGSAPPIKAGTGSISPPIKVGTRGIAPPINKETSNASIEHNLSGSDTKFLTPDSNVPKKTEVDKYPRNVEVSDIHKTISMNPNDLGIQAQKKKVEPHVDVDGKYTFYFTGGDKEMLINGISVELKKSYNPNQCRDELLKVLKNKIDITNKQLLIYLPGGIPFIAGTLGDIYLNENFTAKNVIYGVLTRQVPETILQGSFPELCNVSDQEHKMLISPLVDSSALGLSDMACLMGYLNHDGIKGDLLLRTCATVIHFPPLITSMNRIIDRNQVVGRDVIAVTSTLYTFFRSYVPISCPDDKVYEYALRMCNLISHISDPPERFPMMNIEVKPGDESKKFLSDLKLGPFVYFWKGDTETDFPFVDFKIQSEEAIENAYNMIASFTPIAPLSMRNATGCSIVKGKDHEYLYLMASPLKDAKSQNQVDIIDPMIGMTESKDVEDFAKQQGNAKSDNTANLIDPERVKKIFMVDFDESKSMIGNLSGYLISPKSNKVHRVTIAYQYLTTFANRTYGYRIPCIQGLVSFNKNITVRCPLSPLVPDFEDKGLRNIHPDSVTKLWDSLKRCCEEIVKFRKNKDGEEIYPNAVSRILVISDGEDYNSTTKVEELVKELIKSEIIVDSVIISSEDECKMLCAICHATGGLCFRPNDVSEGLSLFEKEAFLNYKERKARSEPLIPGESNTIPSRLKRNQSIITADLMNKAKDTANFDQEVVNKEMAQASANVRLATPRHICGKNMNIIIPNQRKRRILRELHAAASINDPESPDYDPDMKIYAFQSTLDRWRVFLKGPERTPYAGKWWYIYVTFPDLYPIQPPIFRFVSVPFHLNVSSEGRICLNIIEKGYISSKHVVDILQEIKELFLLPSIETPIQIETLDIFKNDHKRYETLAKESADKNAKDNYQDYIDSAFVLDDVPNDFTIIFTEHIPPYMISQISGKKIPKEKLVMSSTGVYYNVDELKQIVTSSVNPICVITGKPLTEKPSDFEDDPDKGAI